MTIQVLFFARLKEIFGESPRRIRLAENATVDELVRTLSHESEKFRLNKLPLVFAVNENFESGETFLKEGDVVALMTPVSGG